MKQGLKEKLEDILAKTQPSLGGADIKLMNVIQGVVTVQYHKPPSNPSACHIDMTRTNKDIVHEVLKDQLRKAVPGFEKVILLEEQ